MNLISLLFLVTMAASTEFYDSELDKLDIEGIINCPKRMKAFTGCFIGRNDCDEDLWLKIKEVVADTLETKCGRCTPKQRHNAKRYFETLKSCYPEDYELFKKKYDPEGKDINATLKALACD